MTIDQPSIMLLSWGFDPERQGGIARFCIQLAHSLRNQGANVEMWALTGLGTTREREEQRLLEERGIRTYVLATRKNEIDTTLRAIVSTVRHTRQQSALIVSLHGALAELCGLFIKRINRSTVIRTVHSQREWYKRPQLGSWVDWASARWLDGEIGVSSKISGTINKRRQEVGARVLAEFIPPITSPSVVHEYRMISQEEARQKLNIPSDKPIIGTVGRFTPQKGFDTLIRAAALLREKGLEYQLYMVGEGRLEGELKQLIHHLNLDHYVHLCPPREEISCFLRCLDLYVSSSRWEGLSLSLLEATLCGLPIVSTEVSGTRDIERLLNVQFYKCDVDTSWQLAEQIIKAGQENRMASTSQLIPLDASSFNPEMVANRYLSYFRSIKT